MSPSTRRFQVLDGMRGIAAFVVLLFHYLIDAEKYPFVANSYIAVDLFFILSGFVIYHSYAGKMRAGMKAGTFINQRFARLAPTVAVGVFLGAVATLAFYGATGQKTDPASFTLVHIGHLFFIPDFIDYNVPAWGIVNLFPSNTPLWSIFFEFVASISFIFLVRLPKWGLVAASVAMFVLLVPGCIYLANATGDLLTPSVGWSPGTFLLGFPRVLFAFLGGMAICALTEEKSRPSTQRLPVYRGLAPALAVYAATLAVLLFPLRLWDIYPFVAIGLFCPLLIAFGARISPKSSWFLKASDWLGQLSFPLYCVHMPVRTFVQAFMGQSPWSLQIVVSIVLSLIASFLVLQLLDWVRARQRLSTMLKPITG